LTESHIDVAVYLFEALAQLFDLVRHVLDTASQVAHLLLDPVHPNLEVDSDIAAGDAGWSRVPGVAINLPLQHAEIPLHAIEALLRRGVLRESHRYRRDREHSQQQDRTDWRQDGSPDHQLGASWHAPLRPGVAPHAGASDAGHLKLRY
jgi:hypothetical protein